VPDSLGDGSGVNMHEPSDEGRAMQSESLYETCTQLTHRLFYHLDEQHYEDLVEMMEPTAVWLRQGRYQRGREENMAAMEARSRTQRIRHVMSNGFVDRVVGDDVVHYIAYMVGYKFDDGVERPPPATIAGPLRFLLFNAVFARQSDGRWLVREMSAVPEFEFAPSQL
jgi:hypothetical protein